MCEIDVFVRVAVLTVWDERKQAMSFALISWNFSDYCMNFEVWKIPTVYLPRKFFFFVVSKSYLKKAI